MVGVRGDILGSGRGGRGLRVREGHGWAQMGPRSRLDFHGNSRKSGDPGGHGKRPPGKNKKKTKNKQTDTITNKQTQSQTNRHNYTLRRRPFSN